jgi:hypothetical protein
MTPFTWADSGTPAPPEASDGSAHAPAGSTNDTKTTEGIPSELRKLSIEQLLEVEITPINVLGSHTHLKGEWMIGYRYMRMNMGGNLDGTHKVSLADVLRQFPVVHTKMTTDMHMGELMYAPSDSLTLMAMIPYESMSMGHLNRAGVRYTTVAAGFSDLMLMGLYTFIGDARKGGNRVLLNAGMSFPTGSIDTRYNTPTRQNQKLEYPMQLGSGTFDLIPGITYLGETSDWAWGVQTIGTLHLGRNKNHYSFGNEFRVNSWGVYKVNDWLAPSLRIDGHDWGNVHGADPEVNPTSNSAYDPNRQKGKRVDLFIGVNLYVPKGKFKENRLTLEAGWPIYQSLKGPQLQTSQLWNIGFNYTFMQ